VNIQEPTQFETAPQEVQRAEGETFVTVEPNGKMSRMKQTAVEKWMVCLTVQQVAKDLAVVLLLPNEVVD
jgi:hypothetical protein